MTNCIFCDIISGQAPAYFVHRDELCVAFMDIQPVNPGHVLVVPSKHAVLFPELDEVSIKHMMWVAQRVDSALRVSGIHCEGINLFLADGRAAGQDVMHVHLHVIPRFSGDGHHLRFSPSYSKLPARVDLERNAEAIRLKMGGAS